MKRLIFLLLLAGTFAAQTRRTMTYSTLTEGQTLSGFRTSAVYLNDADRPMGARFVHQPSGFTLDVLEIQSVPQAFVWVKTFPTSDMGEPHTQEHLLLGKGNKGRDVASHETMTLTSSTAFTLQWKTCYHFYTPAGSDVFFEEFERRMDALLHPDYSDEEVRREVRNFAVAKNDGDGSLRLEEKGTVYNEMVTSMDQPSRRLYYASMEMVYGKNHPLSYVSGGTPEALRVLQPDRIREFHNANYHLANMGAIVSVPRETSLQSVLSGLDAILKRVQPQKPNRPVLSEKDFPAPKPVRNGDVRFVPYPNKNEQQPGQVRIVWPAERTFDIPERSLFELFLETFAGDPTTNLYKLFIDSNTRQSDLGAQSVAAGFQEELGHSVTVLFGDVPAAKMNQRDLAGARDKILAELQRVASWKDGAPELIEFNDRLRSRVIQARRGLSKFVNSPPGFGFRGTSNDWEFQLELLNKLGGFRRSLTMKPAMDFVERTLAGNRNIWARYIPKWKLNDVQPWILAAKAAPDLGRLAQEERETRIAAEVLTLKQRYAAASDQEALVHYATDYDKQTAQIDATAAGVRPPKFVANPPMTLDDQLDYKVTTLPGGIPLVASTFDSMTSATAGLALRLDGIPESQLLFVSALPALLTRVGVIENGRPVPFEEMSERLRKEILSLSADFGSNSKTGRVELIVRGSGNTIVETQQALQWMQLVLFASDWRPENLSRIRDVVDQALSGLRRTPQTAEENWVNPVGTAYWRQDNPLLLAATSFMTQTHNLYRLRWMLKGGSPPERAATAQALEQLAGMKGSRAELKVRLGELQNGADKILADAAKDLDQTLSDVPDSSLLLDWPHLCREMAADLLAGPEAALSAFTSLRTQLLKTQNARLFLVGSNAAHQSLEPNIQKLTSLLDKTPVVRATYTKRRLVADHLLERDPSATNPVFVGLLNPNSQGGVFLHSAPGTSYDDTDRDKLLDFIAAYLYGGGGGHSIFMKTVGAGMAYSNGIGMRLAQGRSYYYAERSPELPLTMKFVIDEVRRADYDASLVDYAIAQAFGGTRSAAGYESRAEAMAANLADGLTPEVVSRFHKEILNLRAMPALADELFKRIPAVYAPVLPGLGVKSADVNDGVFFVIGPEKQLAAWEEYLKSVEGSEARFYRLYPRDFWL